MFGDLDLAIAPLEASKRIDRSCNNHSTSHIKNVHQSVSETAAQE